MDLVHPQLAAFAAVLEEGSFEAAARRLAISPSALSQRIKALEDRLGQVLLVRQAPCRPTAAGEVLQRSVRPMQALQAEALAELLPERGNDATRTPIPLAVNDDSLDTWFVAAIAELHQRHGYLFDLRMDDQDHTLELLRDGSVLGAVTAEGHALKGCNVHPLGAMRYHAIASPAFARRWFGKGMQADALAVAPMIVFNRKDELQARFLRRLTRARLQPPTHYLPSSTGFVEAAARGLGWCLAPETLIEPALAAGNVVVLEPDRWLDVPLYWQHAAVRSSTLQQITQALRSAAEGCLR
ncbi:ArgP/LysG family DNA-binding transcriptional regulator [Stenotrophomonas sp. SPM]|uniref:LysR family transcriptional regulator ArgP n=1 Tax=unclassified Stenotrophomonas TaxID=196198 RepID=UPI000DE63F3E|nr:MULTISPECIES: LysR family transcriptional regulator ArgP [unclassified Stenotrophomonas]PWB24535.1 ArgP/LysG family DNA-binding transcriptional regulator [Stenotrophomonas sp. SPM]